METRDVTNIAHIEPYVLEKLKERGLIFNLAHGPRHYGNVRMETKILSEICQIAWSLAECLEIIAVVHDVGRLFPGNHAENSAKIFLEMPITDLPPETGEAIAFAVAHHNKGLSNVGVTRASNFKEALLGLFILCDHADGIGAEGFARTAAFAKEHAPTIPLLSQNYTAAEIKEFIMRETRLSSSFADHYNRDSIIASLAWQLQATFSILEPVGHLLTDDYRAYYGVKVSQTKQILEALLLQQEIQDETDRRLKDFIRQLIPPEKSGGGNEVV